MPKVVKLEITDTQFERYKEIQEIIAERGLPLTVNGLFKFLLVNRSSEEIVDDCYKAMRAMSKKRKSYKDES